MTSTEYDYLFKLLVIGDTGVGKTSVTLRTTENKFDPVHDLTIGVDFKTHMLTTDNGKQVKLQIWDTAGQERFKTIVRSFYRGAKGIVLCFDLSRPDTLESLASWIEEINKVVPYCDMILVGNKKDMPSKTPSLSIERFVRDYDLTYVEVSAKEQTNKDMDRQIFHPLVESMIRTRIEMGPDSRVGVSLETETTRFGSGRCGC